MIKSNAAIKQVIRRQFLIPMETLFSKVSDMIVIEEEVDVPPLSTTSALYYLSFAQLTQMSLLSPLLTVEAHLISLSHNRTIKASTGAKIGTIRKKRLPAITMTGIKQAWYLGSLEDERKCRVQMKGLFNPTTCNAEIYLGDTVIGEVSGNWSARSYTISIDNKQVAEVKRHTGITGHILNKDEYVLEITAGVDTAFISMVVIALDEMYHDDGNKRGW